MIEIREDTVNSFDSEVSKGVSLVDFSALWCSPCKFQAAILESLEKKMASLKVININIDEEQSLAKKFEVQSLPTIIILKDGQMVKKLVGLQREDALLQEIAIAKA